MTQDNELRCVLNWYNYIKQKKKDKNRWSKWSQLMQFLQQNILAWPEIPPNFHMEFKTSDLQNLLLTTEICLYPVRCSLSCSGMRLTSFMAEKSRTPHQLKVPLGFVTGRLQPVFPIRTAAEPWMTLCVRFTVGLYHFGAVNTVLPSPFSMWSKGERFCNKV